MQFSDHWADKFLRRFGVALGRHESVFEPDFGGSTMTVESFQSGKGADRLDGASESGLAVFDHSRASPKHVDGQSWERGAGPAGW